MFNVRLAGDHLYGKWLFIWLSLVVFLMVSYCVLSLFSYEMSWMRPGTELSQFLAIFPTYVFTGFFTSRCRSSKLNVNVN